MTHLQTVWGSWIESFLKAIKLSPEMTGHEWLMITNYEIIELRGIMEPLIEKLIIIC